MKRVEEATHLGATIAEKEVPMQDINSRGGSIVPLFQQLHTFWRESKCDADINMRRLQAVVFTQIAYT